MELLSNFFGKINFTDSCWYWTAGKTKAGYGMFVEKGKHIYAHRFAYKTFKSKLTKGLVLDHLCRNRACVNPEHLEEVTMKTNYERGVAPEKFTRWNAYKDSCKKGHPLVTSNRYFRQSKPHWRECNECRRLASKEYQRRVRSSALIINNS